MRYKAKTGTIAFFLQRLTGVSLSIYLLIHIAAKGSFFDQGKLILFSLIIIHALNGLRLTVIDLGWGANKQKEIFWAFLLVGLSLIVYLLV